MDGWMGEWVEMRWVSTVKHLIASLQQVEGWPA